MLTQQYSIKTFNNSSIVSVHVYVKPQGTGYTAYPFNYTFQFHKRNIFAALHFPCNMSEVPIKLWHISCIIMISRYLYAMHNIIRFLNYTVPHTIDIFILLKPVPLKSVSLFIHCSYVCSGSPLCYGRILYLNRLPLHNFG